MTTGTRIRLQVLGRFVSAVFALIALGTGLSVAQTSTATILGVVKATSGALVPGVSITVKHTESGLTRSVVSGERGAYTVPLLPVGAYQITTTMPGFKQVVRSGKRPGSFLSFRSRRMPSSRPRAARGYLHLARFISPLVSIRTCSPLPSRYGT